MSHEKDTASSSPLPAPKYSRYRSVRVAPTTTPAQPVREPKDNDSPFTRTQSMSRYRRPQTRVGNPLSAAPPLPIIPPSPNTAQKLAATGARDVTRKVTEPTPSSPRSPRQIQSGITQRRVGHGQPETGNERARRRADELDGREQEQRRFIQEQKERERIAQEKRAAAEAERARLADVENARLLAEQKRKDLERLQAELDAATTSGPHAQSTTSPKDKFGFFSRRRNTKTNPPEERNLSPAKSIDAPTTSSGRTRSPTKSHDAPINLGNAIARASNDLPPSIQQGGGGIVPGTDAPISAVNAGERRVLIRCKQSSINLPITPVTTPDNIVYSAANIMAQDISPAAAVLVESYTQLGLERRIRRYEKIRDIMNSWDRDTQNALIIENSDTPIRDKQDLEAAGVPKEAPKDVTVYLYHSQKPGKWNKRWVTLLSTGQIYMSKKQGTKPSDKDAWNLCHLSDFDIYSPTAQQARKVLKPPKKHCCAIKSQQKTTMFLSTENFVHFFSTDHEEDADRWFSAVQSWRSWYLVNKMDQGQKKKKGKAVKELVAKTGTKSLHAVKVSVDESPYTIGSFKPLMNMDRFGTPDKDQDSEDENRPLQIPFHLRNSAAIAPDREKKRHPPPVAYKLPPEAEEFSSTGLLGRTYSQHQQALKDRENNPRGSGIIDGSSSGSSSQTPGRTLSMRSTRTKRPETSNGPNSGKPEMPKPLLDFTPQFEEAPQWNKKGKGRGVAAPSNMPLVEVATTPETGLDDIPKTTLFRRETSGARPTTSGAAFVKGGLVSGPGGNGNGGVVNRGRVT